jgi:DnaJ like chaperone protein
MNEASEDMDEAAKATDEAEKVRQEASWERELRKMPPASASSSYAILELNENATDMEIKKAFRKLVERYHPDRGKYSALTNAENFRQVQEAYAVLRDHRGFFGARINATIVAD